MRLLNLKRGVALACAVLASTACGGGDFHVTGNDTGLSGTGGKKGAGGRSAGGGASSGGSDADGAASGGRGGQGARGGTSGSGGASSGGTTGGGADAGSDGGAASGGTGNGGSAGHGNGGRAGHGNGGTASGGGNTGGGGGTGGAGGMAGAGAHPQFVKDYSRKCQYDSECTLVYQGNDVCTCDAQCSNASIATSALTQWNADRQAMNCPALPCSLQNCDAMVASCGASLCYARKPVTIDASHYDQTCLSATDCTTIPTGEICSPCQCSRGAVSTKGYQNYLKDKQNVQCSPGPVACDCAPQPTTLTCVLSISGSGIGKCTLTTGATTL